MRIRFLFIIFHIVVFSLRALHASTETTEKKSTIKPLQKIGFEEGLKTLLEKNAKILQGNAQLLSFKALHDKAENVLIPSISFLSFVSPMFRLRGNALKDERDYTKWGPFFYGQVDITMPLFSFGQIDSGRKAAEYALRAGKNLRALTINEQILEYKKLYLSAILLKRLKSVLDDAEEKIKDIIDRAELAYAEGVGEVKRKDLTRLKLFGIEIEKYQIEWKINKESSAKALGHFLGTKESIAVVDADFPIIDDAPVLEKMIQIGFQKRPDYKALTAGLIAREHQLELEKGSSMPVVFLGTHLEGTYSNMSERQSSVYAYDPFNTVFAGVALGVRWKMDWSERLGKIGKAKSELEEMISKRKEAETGIPLKISLAYWDLIKQKKYWELSEKKYRESAGWAMSELSAYAAGVGDTKDLLEAYGAFLLSRKDIIEAEYKYCTTWAKLSFEVGEASMLSAWKERELE